MFRAVVSLFVIVTMLIFASQNMEEAEIHVVAGRPQHVPLILIIAVSFVSGYAMAILSFIFSNSRKRKKRDNLPTNLPPGKR
ncbi:MAG: LapA family protein [Gammaproteobacteria bacterium]|nr:LapA family protein [Gammaproteobacteria bacterium]